MIADGGQDVRFGLGGNDRNYLGEGWSAAEAGWRWMIGRQSEVILSHPPGDAPACVVEMDISVFVRPPSVPAQTLTARIGEIVVFRARLTEAGRIGFIVDRAALGDGPLRLVFEHPDAAVPAEHGAGDDRRSLSVRLARLRLTPVPPASPRPGSAPDMRTGRGGVTPEEAARQAGRPLAAFVAGFESLGDNCEFGLVQRRCGAEPLGLLRFANIGLARLLAALDDGFAGAGTSMRVTTEGGRAAEVIVHDDACAITYHTFQFLPDADPAAILARQPGRQKLLARKLLEDAALGEKIFVIRRNPPLAEHEVLPLYAALRRLGPVTLLWADVAEDGTVPGTVERILPGLLHGWVDRLAPDADAHDLSLDAWLDVCLNAAELHHAAPGEPRTA